jgi:hypothetical protein
MMVKNKKMVMITWIVIFGSIIIGGLLGVYLIGRETGEFDFDLVLAILVGTLLGFFIYLLFSKWNKKRRGNIPEIDERSIKIIQRYFIVVLYVILIGSGACLLFLFATGVQYIETGMLIFCMAILYIVIGVGAVVVKRF